MCKFPGTLSKKVFSLLVLVSFLSQNCLFPLPVSAISGDKLSAQSFFQTEQVKNIISRIKEQGLDKELKSVLTILTPRLTKALELYLKTIILRRKRQQELLLERELLHEMEILGQLDELRKQGILVKHIAQMDNVELRALIKQLPDGKWFRQELERRHNGIDAAYFSENAEDSYALLQELADDGFIAADSPFRQAAAVIAYAKTAGKYVNSLTGVDFTLGQLDEVSGNQAEANYLRKIFNFYTQEIKKEHKKDLYFKRGAVPCMLYELGITAFPRMSSWRMHVPGDPQKGLDPAEQKRAEECILRLIDFLSDHEITKEGKVINRICKKSYAETANALVYNDYTKGSVSAALEQRLGFKAGGIVNPFDPAPGDAFNFNALVINACKRRMQAGDARFAGVSEEAMFRSYVGKVTLPRIRAMCMFGWSIFGYNLLRTRNLLQLKDIIDRYFNYVGGNELMLTKDECDLVDELYQKLNEKLLAQFELGEGEALGEDLPQALIDLLIVLSNLPYNRNEQGSYAAEKYPDRYPQELREEMQLLRSLAAKFVPRQAKIGNLAYRQYKALPDSFKQGAVRIITSQDLDSAETKAQMQRLAVIYNELIVSSKQLLAAMVYRYNSRRPLWGPLRDSLVQTPAWASGIWAEWFLFELKAHTEDQEVVRALEINSAGSFMLSVAEGREGIDTAAVITDHLREEDYKPFSRSREIREGELAEVDVYDVVFSIYDKANMNTPEEAAAFFQKMHSLLHFGGRLIITLPARNKFSEETFEYLKAMGYKVEHAAPAYLQLQDAEKNIEGEQEEGALKKRGFYGVVLQKVGQRRHLPERPEEAFIIDVVPQEAETAERRRQRDGADRVGGTKDKVNIRPAYQPRSGTCRTGSDDSAALAELLSALGNYDEEKNSLRQEAERRTDLLRAVAESRLLIDDFISGHWYSKEKPKPLVPYLSREQYEEVLLLLSKAEPLFCEGQETDDLELLSMELLEAEEHLVFISENYAEFERLLLAVRELKMYAEGITDYQAVCSYQSLDLNKENLEKLRRVYQELKKREEEKGEEKEKEEKWPVFREKQKYIVRYQRAASLLYRRAARYAAEQTAKILAVTAIEDFTMEELKTARTVEQELLKGLAVAGIYPDLKCYDQALRNLFSHWWQLEFMFNPNDMLLLEQVRKDWDENLVLPEQSVFGAKDRKAELNQLTACLGIVWQWRERGSEIDFIFNTPMGKLMRPASAVLMPAYMTEFDQVTIYRQLQNHLAKQEGGPVWPEDIFTIMPGTTSTEINQRLAQLEQGERLLLAVSDYFQFPASFLTGLARQGFTVEYMLAAHLEVTADQADTTKLMCDYVRRGKRLLFIRRLAEGEAVEDGTFSLKGGVPEVCPVYYRQRHAEWRETLEMVLDFLKPADLKLAVDSLEEYLNRSQIVNEYSAAVADRLLIGDKCFATRTEIAAIQEQLAAEETQKRGREEAAQRLKKRQRKKKKKKKRGARDKKGKNGTPAEPEVPISSQVESWQELVAGEFSEADIRDLGYILLQNIADFEDPPPAVEIVESAGIGQHPRLGRFVRENSAKFPLVELLSRVDRLIEIRQYELVLGRVYRALTMLAAYVVPGRMTVSNARYFKKDRLLDVMGVGLGGKSNFCAEIMFGNGFSPFAAGSEACFMEIVGDYLCWRDDELSGIVAAQIKSLKAGGALTEDEADPASMGGDFIVHCLFDEDNKLARFHKMLAGLQVYQGRESFTYENLETINAEESGRHDICREAAEVATLLLTVDPRVVSREELEKLETVFYRMLSAMPKGGSSLGEIGENILLTLKSCKMYLGLKKDKGVIAEIADIMQEAVQETEWRQETQAMGREKERMASGKVIYEDYVYGDKAREILAENKDEVGFYADIQSCLNGVELYHLSVQEKETISAVVAQMVLCVCEKELEELFKQLGVFIRTRNSANRFLYTYYSLMRDLWRTKIAVDVKTQMFRKLSYVLAVDPQIAICVRGNEGEDPRENAHRSLIALLTEFYRVGQMMRDPEMEFAALDMQWMALRLNNLIRDKLTKVSYDERSINKLHKCAELAAGNPLHANLIFELPQNLRVLRDLYQYEIFTFIDSKIIEELFIWQLAPIRHQLSNAGELAASRQLAIFMLEEMSVGMTEIEGEEVEDVLINVEFQAEIAKWRFTWDYCPKERPVLLQNIVEVLKVCAGSDYQKFYQAVQNFENKNDEDVIEAAAAYCENHREEFTPLALIAFLAYIAFWQYVPGSRDDLRTAVLKVKKIEKKDRGKRQLYRRIHGLASADGKEVDLRGKVTEVNRLLSVNASFRLLKVVTMFSLCQAAGSELADSRAELDRLFSLIRNPQELKYYWRLLASYAEKNKIGFPGEIVKRFSAKMLYFLETARPAVEELLLGSYQEISDAELLVLYCFRRSKKFRRFLVDKIFDQEPRFAGNAFFLLKEVVAAEMKAAVSGKQCGRLHEAFNYLIDKLLEQGSEINGIQMNAVFWLINDAARIAAVRDIDFSLTAKWERIYAAYNEGKINAEVLLGINAELEALRKAVIRDSELKGLVRQRYAERSADHYAVFAKGVFVLAEEEEANIRAKTDRLLVKISEKEQRQIQADLISYLAAGNTLNRFMYYVCYAEAVKWLAVDAMIVKGTVREVLVELVKLGVCRDLAVFAKGVEKAESVEQLIEFVARVKQLQFHVRNDAQLKMVTGFLQELINKLLYDLVGYAGDFEKAFLSAFNGDVYWRDFADDMLLCFPRLAGFYPYAFSYCMSGEIDEEFLEILIMDMKRAFIYGLHKTEAGHKVFQHVAAAISGLPQARKIALAVRISDFEKDLALYLGGLGRTKGVKSIQLQPVRKLKKALAGNMPAQGTDKEFRQAVRMLLRLKGIRDDRLDLNGFEEVENIHAQAEIYQLMRLTQLFLKEKVMKGKLDPNEYAMKNAILVSRACKIMATADEQRLVEFAFSSIRQMELLEMVIGQLMYDDRAHEIIPVVIQQFFSADPVAYGNAYHYLHFFLTPDEEVFPPSLHRREAIEILLVTAVRGVLEQADEESLNRYLLSRIVDLMMTALTNAEIENVYEVLSVVNRYYAEGKITKEVYEQARKVIRTNYRQFRSAISAEWKISRLQAMMGAHPLIGDTSTVPGDGQIGKKAEVAEVMVERKEFKVVGQPGPIGLNDLAVDISQLEDVLCQQVEGEEEREIIRKILRAFVDLPVEQKPSFYFYETLVGDLCGFARPEARVIALYEDFSANPLALFHEIAEYLSAIGELELKIENLYLAGEINGIDFTLQVSEALESLWLEDSNHWPKHWQTKTHYLLRVLQRQLLLLKDEYLSVLIKTAQKLEKKVRIMPDEGDVIKGRYSLVSRLPRAGMAEVWLADDLMNANEEVIVKIGTGDQVKYLMREAVLMRMVEGKCVATGTTVSPEVYSHGQSPYGYFIAMEKISGESLIDWLNRNIDRGLTRTPHGILKIKRLGQALLEMLAPLHEAGILHHDVKPQNIIVAQEAGKMTLKLLDYGLAADTTLEQKFAYHGTVGYMAPETIARKQQSLATDIFPVGVILFEALTGRNLFQRNIHQVPTDMRRVLHYFLRKVSEMKSINTRTVSLCFTMYYNAFKNIVVLPELGSLRTFIENLLMREEAVYEGVNVSEHLIGSRPENAEKALALLGEVYVPYIDHAGNELRLLAYHGRQEDPQRGEVYLFAAKTEAGRYLPDYKIARGVYERKYPEDEDDGLVKTVAGRRLRRMFDVGKIKRMAREDTGKLGVNLQGRFDYRTQQAGLLKQEYIGHDMAVCEVVNPAHAAGLRAVYGGAGTDIVNFLLSTDVAEACFVDDRYAININRMEDLLEHHWERLPEICHNYIRDKSVDGYSNQVFIPRTQEAVILLELKALGVARDDITSIEENVDGTVTIYFDWCYKYQAVKSYKVSFVCAKMEEIASLPADHLLRRMLETGIDIYYQRAAMSIPDHYAEFLPLIIASLNENGFLVMDNNHGMKAERISPEPLFADLPGIKMTAQSTASIQYWAKRIPQLRQPGVGKHYAWDVDIWQQQAAAAEHSGNATGAISDSRLLQQPDLFGQSV